MKQNLTISYEEYIVKFKGLIKSLGLNNSIQREYECDLEFHLLFLESNYDLSIFSPYKNIGPCHPWDG